MRSNFLAQKSEKKKSKLAGFLIEKKHVIPTNEKVECRRAFVLKELKTLEKRASGEALSGKRVQDALTSP